MSLSFLGTAVCKSRGAANLGCSRLSAGSFGAQDGQNSRLKAGCGQDCPPHNKCRIPDVGKLSDIGLIACPKSRCLEREPHAEAEVPLIDRTAERRRVGDLTESAQTPH